MVTSFESDGAKLRVGFLAEGEERRALDDAVAEVLGKLEENPPIEMFGKVVRQRRHVAFFADPNDTYGYFYSGSVAKSKPLGDGIRFLMQLVNAKFEAQFNGVLVNYYPDGSHYISDHSDSESGLDPHAGVVIVSVGAARTMHFKRAKNASEGACSFEKQGSHKVTLSHASVVAMQGPKFQKCYTHGIPKEEKTAPGPRWSFTFRRHTKEGEAKKIAAAEKTLARIAAKLAAEEEEPAAKRAKTA